MSSQFAGLGEAPAWQRWKMDSLEPAHKQRAPGGLPTVGELEQMQEQVRSEGYDEGRAQGLAASAADAQRLQSLANTLEQTIAALHNEIAEQVLTLALDLARQMLQEALPVKKDLLLPVVREAIRGMPSATQPAQILLNPADVELVRAHFGEELRIGSWQIVEDHRIQPGGCRLASKQGEVDATLASRWKHVVATLGRDHAWLDP